MAVAGGGAGNQPTSNMLSGQGDMFMGDPYSKIENERQVVDRLNRSAVSLLERYREFQIPAKM